MEYLDGHVLGCHFIATFALVSYVDMLIKSVNSCEFSATQLVYELCIQSNWTLDKWCGIKELDTYQISDMVSPTLYMLHI